MFVAQTAASVFQSLTGPRNLGVSWSIDERLGLMEGAQYDIKTE